MIKVDRLTKYYGEFLALRDVSFETSPGEIVGLLGPNGAGKTTTMRIITTFLPQSEGKVWVDGLDTSVHSLKVREKIGYLPENPPLYHDMRVQQFLRFIGKLRGMKRQALNERINHVLETCRLEHMENRLIAHLSKGYRQRVGLAAAIISNPPVLILDEPAIGLDPAQIKHTQNMIRGLGGSHTILFSTHILSQAQAVCHRLAIINKGQLIAWGTTQELAKKIRPANAYRVEFSGEVDKTHMATQNLREAVDMQTVRPGQYIVEFKPEHDGREILWRLARDKSWTILELTPMESSLEDVFLQLVDDTKPDFPEANNADE